MMTTMMPKSPQRRGSAIALVALFIVARLMVAGGCKAWRWNQARRAQLWADTHRYPLSLPDAREAGR